MIPSRRVCRQNPTICSRGNCAESQFHRSVDTANSYKPYLDGGCRCSPSAASHEVAFKVVRHELPYLLCIPLCSTLVQSMEPKMVCGIFTDHVSSIDTAVGGADVSNTWVGHGVYGCAVCSHHASCAWRLSIFPALGQRARGIIRGPG